MKQLLDQIAQARQHKTHRETCQKHISPAQAGMLPKTSCTTYELLAGLLLSSCQRCIHVIAFCTSTNPCQAQVITLTDNHVIDGTKWQALSISVRCSATEHGYLLIHTALHDKIVGTMCYPAVCCTVLLNTPNTLLQKGKSQTPCITCLCALSCC